MAPKRRRVSNRVEGLRKAVRILSADTVVLRPVFRRRNFRAAGTFWYHFHTGVQTV